MSQTLSAQAPAPAALPPHLKLSTSPLTQELRGQMAVLTTDETARTWDLRHRAADRIEALEAALRELEEANLALGGELLRPLPPPGRAAGVAAPVNAYDFLTARVPGIQAVRIRLSEARRTARALLGQA